MNSTKEWKSVSREEQIKTFTGHKDNVRSVVFSPNGEYLASGSYDRTIKVWKVSSGESIKTLKGHRDII